MPLLDLLRDAVLHLRAALMPCPKCGHELHDRECFHQQEPDWKKSHDGLYRASYKDYCGCLLSQEEARFNNRLLLMAGATKES